MKIQRRSTWNAKRSDWYREAALREVRQTAGFQAVALAIVALIIAFFGADHLGTWFGKGAVLVGCACAALGVGLWFGQRWAIRSGGVVQVAVVVIGLVALPVALFMGHEMSAMDVVWRGFLLVSLWESSQSLFDLAEKPVVPDARGRQSPEGDRAATDESSSIGSS